MANGFKTSYGRTWTLEITPWTLEMSHGLKQAMNIRDDKWFKNKLWKNMDIGDNTMDIRDVTWFKTSYEH